jgi:pimeloyl-ACP methyl ester carboxylesterase
MSVKGTGASYFSSCHHSRCLDSDYPHMSVGDQFKRSLLVRFLVAVALVLPCATNPTLAKCPLRRARESTFPLSGGSYINYREAGQGDRVVVALHGFGASLDTWNEIAPDLTSHYRVFMPDLPGFGLSAKPNEFSYSISEQANHIADFVRFVHNETKAQVTLIGHSYGGSISLAACLVLKEKHESLIDRLILVDALGFPETVHFPIYINILRVPVLDHLVLNLLPARRRARIVLKDVIFDPALVTPERICRYAQFLDLPGEHRALIQTAHQLGNGRKTAAFTGRIGQIDIPTLIVWGSHDRLIPPAQAGLLHAAIAQSERAAFLETGHLPHEELPHDTAALIWKFLDQ